MYELTPDLLTGNKTIDSQHKELIDALNGLMTACSLGKGRDELAKCIQFLAEYTEYHFSQEEKLQLQSTYPDYQNHKKLHAEFKTKIQTLGNKLHAEGPTIILVGELNMALGQWLLQHIKREDKKVAEHIHKIQ